MAPTMSSSTIGTAWLLLALAFAGRVHGLSQVYCSNQNTGADYQGGSDIYNSNGACKTKCQGEYAFAVVQWQSCWCSNYAPAEQSDTSSCDQQCPGYPQENCGNEDNGMYGYIALGRAPSGTLGASSSAQPSSTYYSSSQPPSSSPPPPSSTAPPSTATSYVSQTVVSTVTQEHTQKPDTVVSTVTPTPSPTSSSTPEYSSTAAPSTSSPSPSSHTHSPTPVVSTRVITVSGQQVTQTVTSTPFIAPGSDEQQQPMSRSGLSGGAIAGIVIGTLIGLAALLLAAFLLWRRKKQQDDERGSPRPKRTTSVLSKTGLLSRGTARPTSMAENNYDEGYSSVRHSMLFGAAGATVEPSSPLGGSNSNASSTRRHSRPLVYDQRLNPSALFANAEGNGSRVSMQDTQDYSRPLGIANPDIRASFDSRISNR